MDSVRVRFVVLALVAASSANAEDWTFYRRDLMGQASSPERLSASDAAGFQGNWTAFTHGWNYANPIVANGVVYLTSGDGNLYAFDVRTGAQLWHQASGVIGPFQCLPQSTSKGPIGAPAVVGSRVFMPGADGFVYAYNATNGSTIWKTKIADVTGAGEFLWTSAFPLNGKIYFGISALIDCVMPPGRMVALDQDTGAVVGTWWADANHGPGGGVWTQPAYDARTNRFFMTTGTIADGLTPDEQPNADAFVAIDPDTMETVDSFSPVAGLFKEDIDFGASPTLFDTDDPVHPHMIAAANKNGIVYALDRDNLKGGVVWSYTISGEGASPDLGESTIVSAPYANGMLFVGGGRRSDGKAGAVAALDAMTGAEKWLKPLDEFVLAAMTTAGDVLIFGGTTPNSFTGHTYVVEQATGNTLFTLPGKVFFGEPTYANGQLFTGDLGGALYALIPAGSSIAPDFALGISPSSQALGAGMTATYAVSTTSVQPVALSVANLPAGVTASFSKSTISAGSPASLVLGAPAGSATQPAASFTVTGTAGKTHTARGTVRVVSLPTAQVTSPAAGAVVSGSVGVEISGAVAGVTTLDSITLYVDGQAVGSSETSPATISWDTKSVTAGEHQLKAVAQDGFGLQGTSAPVTVIVDDLVVPAVSVDAGGLSGSVAGTVTLHAKATPSGAKSITRLDVLVDGVVLQSGSAPEIQVDWDTKKVADGAHTIVASATDSAGRTATSAELKLTTGNQSASLSVGGKGGGCATTPGEGSTAAAGLIALAIALRARRRERAACARVAR